MDLDNNLANIKLDTDLFGKQTPRLSMKERIGFVPISIWQPDWNTTKELKKIVGDDGSGRAEFGGGNKRTMGASYKESLGNNPNAVSIFNPHLAQMILSAYCPTGANIYDPFAGGGTRGFIASAMGHSYTGVEIRQPEVDRIIKQQWDLNLFFNIFCGDSTIFTDEPKYNFSYTCPPYYDLEVYSNLEKDISTAKTYLDFLDLIKKSLAQTFAILQPDSLAVWVVGNFRDKHGYLQHFNGDLIRQAKDVGFNLLDELIFWGASGAAAQRAGQFGANRKSVRVHEYIVVLQK